MSEAKHTVGKLRQCKGSHKDSCICGLIYAPDSDLIFGSVHVERCPVLDHADSAPPTEESKANVRRVVAAWNSCDGLSTESLESGVVGELLAACKDALATGERDMQHFLDNGRLRDVLLAAIAKAEGNK